MTAVTMNNVNLNTQLFQYLTIGDWFKFNTDFYIKVSSTQATNLNTGKFIPFAGDATVIYLSKIEITYVEA